MYCDFASGSYDHDRASIYIDALKKELSFLRLKKKLDTIYIGGGTPTVLGQDLLKELVGFIFNRFGLSDNYEATIEANPGTVDKEKLLMLHDSDINRLSIGVQSFNEKELRFLGRIHTGEEAVTAVKLAREAGYENLGIDLIYGIPGQTISDWKEMLKKTVDLQPEHISAYELTVETGTELDRMLSGVSPLKRKAVYSGNITLPSEELIIDMYNHTIDYLTGSGFDHYEISNYAKPGKFSRHNMTYWDRNEYYGAGLGAHSFIKNSRFSNTEDLDEYIDALLNGRSPRISSEDITPEKALSEEVFLGLRKTAGIDLHALRKLYGVDLLTKYKDAIDALNSAKLISIDKDLSRLKLTRKGLVLSNEVFSRFI